MDQSQKSTNTENLSTLKVLIRKNLKMSANKAASQAVHAAIGLMLSDPRKQYSRCVVLSVSDRKFAEKIKAAESHWITRDAGRTEVEPGTETALAFWE